MTIDAMDCQTEIAERIVAKNTDDVLYAKENQPTLCQEIRQAFDAAANGGKTVVRSYSTREKGHGREDQGQRSLGCGSGEGFHREAFVPAAGSALHGEAVFDGVLFQKREGEPVPPGEVLS